MAALQLSDLKDYDDVAALLGTTSKKLVWWLYRSHDSYRYRSFEIPKRRGGTRRIDAPIKAIGDMQRALATALAPYHKPYPSAQAYIKGRSIVDNARKHRSARWILNVDLANFYGSISFARVLGLLKSHPFNVDPRMAAVLAQLATNGSVLPQGAPSSPLISNLIAHRLDKQLTLLAKRLRCQYSRYADDLTFSSRSPDVPSALVTDPRVGRVEVGPGLRAAIHGNGFEINQEKCWISRSWQRRIVTGIQVDTQVRVPSRYYRNLRAAVRQARLDPNACVEHFRTHRTGKNPSFNVDIASILRGKVEFVGMVEGETSARYQDLLHEYYRAFPTIKRTKKMLNSQDRYDLFICHSSADKDTWVRPLVDLLRVRGIACWYDESNIGLGQSIPAKINDGLRRSDALIAFVTRSFLKKDWALSEVGALLYREIQRKTTEVIPVVAGGSEVFEQYSDELPFMAQKKAMSVDAPADLPGLADDLAEFVTSRRPTSGTK